MIYTFIDQLISYSSSHETMGRFFISRLHNIFSTVWRVRHALLWEPLLQVTFILWIQEGFQQVLGLVYLLERDSNSFCDLFEVIKQTAAGFLKTLKRFLSYIYRTIRSRSLWLWELNTPPAVCSSGEKWRIRRALR